MARGTRNVGSATVRGEYANGTGWDAGQNAPSTKYVDGDGKVTDKEPRGEGARILVAEGDVVRPHMVEAIKAGNAAVPGRALDNENSPGDASHGRRRRRGAAEGDGTTQPSGAGTTEGS